MENNGVQEGKAAGLPNQLPGSLPLKKPSPEAINNCIEVLETLLHNRILLGDLAPETRKTLFIAAGRLSRPERLEVMRLAKQHRLKRKQALNRIDRSSTATTQIRKNRTSAIYVPPTRLLGTDTPKATLNQARHCYVCKIPFQTLHHFYDSMCESCAHLNYEKRFMQADLTGRVALITGSRVKIGFQAALMLLRAGARVIVTTRYPRDAAFRYSKEADFGQWSDRLQIHGLDLRHSPSVELYTRLILQSYDRLDFLINNAAQTVRRPPGFYRHLLEIEETPLENLPTPVQSLLTQQENWLRNLNLASASGSGGTTNGMELVNWKNPAPDLGLKKSASLSLLPYTFEATDLNPEFFPEGARDADLQQVDLRKMNSWRMTLADVPTAEMLEVQLINSIAPFILCSKLKPLMLRDKTFDKHVVNVSAMEGKFSRHTKTDKHPHTNMAKAALNMLTLTSAADYAKDGIYMNAVDTGWVTDEDPLEISQRKQQEHDFQPPLDIVDGAARIIDPIFTSMNTGVHVWGKFLKDYRPTEW